MEPGLPGSKLVFKRLFEYLNCRCHLSLQGQGGSKRRVRSPPETLAQEPARPVLHLKLGHLLTQELNLHAVMGAVRSQPCHSHPRFQCIRLSIEFGDSRTCFLLTRTCHWRLQGHGLGFLGCCCGDFELLAAIPVEGAIRRIPAVCSLLAGGFWAWPDSWNF